MEYFYKPLLQVRLRCCMAVVSAAGRSPVLVRDWRRFVERAERRKHGIAWAWRALYAAVVKAHSDEKQTRL